MKMQSNGGLQQHCIKLSPHLPNEHSL